MDAGLVPRSTFDITWAYEYTDEEELGRAMLAPAGVGDLVGPAREGEVRRQIVDALASCRTPEGPYRLENEFHVLLASA